MPSKNDKKLCEALVRRHKKDLREYFELIRGKKIIK